MHKDTQQNLVKVIHLLGTDACTKHVKTNILISRSIL